MRRAALLAAVWSGVAGAGDVQSCTGIDAPAQRLACYDAAAGRAAAAVPVPPSTASSAPPEADFGKPPAPAPSASVKAIEARIVGTVKRWERGTRFTLDNGQVWKATGDESAYYPDLPDNPAVTIRRGLLGSYWMELTAAGRKIKVQRLS